MFFDVQQYSQYCKCFVSELCVAVYIVLETKDQVSEFESWGSDQAQEAEQ